MYVCVCVWVWVSVSVCVVWMTSYTFKTKKQKNVGKLKITNLGKTSRMYYKQQEWLKYRMENISEIITPKTKKKEERAVWCTHKCMHQALQARTSQNKDQGNQYLANSAAIVSLQMLGQTEWQWVKEQRTYLILLPNLIPELNHKRSLLVYLTPCSRLASVDKLHQVLGQD